METNKGTKIYRSQLICLLNEMDTLPLEYAYLDSFRIDEFTFIEIVKLFSSLKNGKNKEEVMASLASLNLPIGEGFSYKDSVYMKEEF